MLVILNLTGFDRIKANLAHENLDGAYAEYFTGSRETMNISKTLTLDAWEYRVYISDDKNSG